MTIRSRDRIAAQARYDATRHLVVTPEPIREIRNHDPKPQRTLEQIRASRAAFLASQSN